MNTLWVSAWCKASITFTCTPHNALYTPAEVFPNHVCLLVEIIWYTRSDFLALFLEYGKHQWGYYIALSVKFTSLLCFCFEQAHWWALVDYASIILGMIGAPEHQELYWHNRHTFLIRWPEHCKLAIYFNQVHCSLIPSNKFLLFTASPVLSPHVH